MSQVDKILVDNGSGRSVRMGFNHLIEAVADHFSGPKAPGFTFAGMFWRDTSKSPAILRVRNDTNTAWIDFRDMIGLGKRNSPTFVGVNATGNVTATGDVTARNVTATGGLYVKGGYVSDGDNDYGLIINAFEPAISLLDRSDSAGSAQIRAQSDGSIWFLRDTRNDGTIGHDSSKTTKIVVKFSPDGPIFYNADGDQIAHIKTDGEVWTKKYGSLDTRFAARNTEAYAVGSYTIALLNHKSTEKSTYINNSLVSGSKFSDDVIMFDIGSDCYAGKISTSSYSASFQREMGITPGTIPGTWRIMTPLYAFHDGTDVEGWTTINLIMRVA